MSRTDLLMALDDTVRDIVAATRQGDVRRAKSLYGRAVHYVQRLPRARTRQHRLVLDRIARDLWPSTPVRR